MKTKLLKVYDDYGKLYFVPLGRVTKAYCYKKIQVKIDGEISYLWVRK